MKLMKESWKQTYILIGMLTRAIKIREELYKDQFFIKKKTLQGSVAKKKKKKKLYKDQRSFYNLEAQ